MSRSQQQRSRRDPVESEIVTHWPTVYAVGGLTVVFLVVPLIWCCWPPPPAPTKPQFAVQAQRTPVQIAKADDAVEPASLPVVPTVEPSFWPGKVVAYLEAPVPPSLPASTATPKPKVSKPAPQIASAPPPVQAEPARFKDAIVLGHQARRVADGLYPHSFRESEEEALQLHLQATTAELDLEGVKGTSHSLLAAARESIGPALRIPVDPLGQAFLFKHLDQRGDLQGLPLRRGADCQADLADVASMAEISALTRRSFARGTRPTSLSGLSMGNSPEVESELLTLLQSKRWRTDAAVTALVQILQVERPMLRLELVRLLADVPGQRASNALVQRALFDLAPDVRAAAAKALTRRPAAEYRHDLLAGFRYPWPFAADHAADALAALKQADAIPALVGMLDQPDPALPFKDQDELWKKREVVRVNHFRNCLLCHAPSLDQKDQVRGVIPTPGRPIPVAYYNATQGEFVQATVTYLRQDFSVMHDVPKAAPWPTRQRHDYFVRTRELHPEETAGMPLVSPGYPQRDAVLLALRALSGQNFGDSAEAWHEYLRREWTGIE